MNKNKVDSAHINTLFSRGQVLILCNYGNQTTQEGNLPQREMGTGEPSNTASEIKVPNPAMLIEFNTL